MSTTFSILLIKLFLAVTCVYDVPSYFGYFSKHFFSFQKLTSGTFRFFQYHYAAALDSMNKTMYFADSKEHCIYKFDLIQKKRQILAGKCGLPGDRVGGLSVMLLSSPMSLAFYQYDQKSMEQQLQMKTFIVKDQNCSIHAPACILSQSQVKSRNLNISNIKFSPQLNQFPQIRENQTAYLYVSDTDNHCIKKINLALKTSMVVAGQCGQLGFRDGPLGYNRINRPTNLGITRSGVLFFYDEGNQYMRKVNNNGSVQTLLNGSCKLYKKSRRIGSYWISNILCYDNWIQYKTKSPVQHVVKDEQLNLCLEHSSRC